MKSGAMLARDRATGKAGMPMGSVIGVVEELAAAAAGVTVCVTEGSNEGIVRNLEGDAREDDGGTRVPFVSATAVWVGLLVEVAVVVVVVM
jgi:hypothetical protein